MLNRRTLLMAGSSLTISHPFVKTLSVFADPLNPPLKYHSHDPANGEPSLASLIRSYITPIENFFIRSHARNPKINATSYRLRVEGMVEQPLSISLADLKKFSEIALVATLTCAGNRRSEFSKDKKINGVPWGSAAIGNAVWRGVHLSDVLNLAGVKSGARHVWLEGLDAVKRDAGTIPFGGSIPIEKALDSRTTGAALLATQMNNKPLTPDHGFPLRAVIPGYIGARSVKWLGKIVVSDRPSTNHYLASAYKLVQAPDPLSWNEAGALYRYPINGAICVPENNAIISAGKTRVRGYALPSGRADCKIKSVLLSTDSGRTWQQANLEKQQNSFCWQLWDAQLNLLPETKSIILRAEDTSGAWMPQRVAWNYKGYFQNGWYRLPVNIR